MLRDMQHQLFEGLYDPQHEAALNLLRPGTRGAAEQLAIYRGSLFGGLARALREVYPVCRKLVGDEFFEQMINRYLPQQRSISPDIADYGETLPDYIAGFAPAAALPYLADVARLEWAWHRAINAPNEVLPDATALIAAAGIKTGKLVLQASCSLGLLESKWPLLPIWEANQEDTPDGTIRLVEGEYRYAVWRRQLELHIEPLAAAQFRFLQLLQEELPLVDLFGILWQRFPGLAVADMLADMLQAGWCRGWHCTPEAGTTTARIPAGDADSR